MMSDIDISTQAPKEATSTQAPKEATSTQAPNEATSAQVPNEEVEPRRSARTPKPTQKVKERAENDFWSGFEEIRLAGARLEESANSRLSASVRMQLQRDVTEAMNQMAYPCMKVCE